MFLLSNKFKSKKIFHAFFTRKGGVSKGTFKSLNFGIGSKDSKNFVRKNFNIIKNKTKLKKIYLVKQYHSNKIIKIKKKYKKQILGDGDGIFTGIKKIGIGILTADCAAVFFKDKKEKFICCVHSGWKGAYKNILKKAIKCFEEQNIKPKDILVALGPCLGTNSYEVSMIFKVRMIKKYKNSNKCFKIKKGKLFFDLRKFIVDRLIDSGITMNNISHVNKDTYKLSNLFYSYRLSLHKKEIDYGRNLSIISKN